MSDLEIREFEIRSVDEDGTFEGYAVRYGEVADIGGRFKESFERGAFEGSQDIKLYRDHKKIIGHVLETEDRAEGFWFKAKVALSELGADTLALLRSGALSKVSVGFVPVQQRDEGGLIVRTKALLREISVVERPAYAGATVLTVREESPEVREDSLTKETHTVDETTNVSADLAEVRGAIEDLDRKFSSLSINTREEAPAVDHRSAAAFVTALAAGDEAAARSYNENQGRLTDELMTRAYTGGTSADAPLQNQWVGDLTRFFDASSGILSETFSNGTLPKLGNTLEYAQEGTVTGAVSEQLAEGDDLSFTKVTLTTKTTTVHTYGGYTQLSFQAIERSTLPLLERNLENLTRQAAMNKKAVFRADYDTVVAARRAVAANAGVVLGGAALASMTPAQWLTTVIAANKKFKSQGYSVDKLIVTDDVFAALVGLTTTGDRVLQIATDNSAGTANIGALRATLFGIPVEVDETPSSGVATGQAVFVNKAAIRQYDSALVSLQDSNIINLSKDFSVYRYGAIADERPTLIVPVKFAAS